MRFVPRQTTPSTPLDARPVADRVPPSCAQACRATASRPTCSSCRRRFASAPRNPAAPVRAADPCALPARRCCSTWRSRRSQAHVQGLRSALALQHARPTTQRPPQPPTRRAAPRPRRASRRAWRASRRAPSAAAASSRREPFEVSDDADSLQMLTRSSQIGEFYVMAPPQVHPRAKRLHTCDISSTTRSATATCASTWRDALKASPAAPWVPPHTQRAAGKCPGRQGRRGRLGDQGRRGRPTGASGSKALQAAAGGGGLDVRIVLARPFIEHLMHNVIMTVAGRDTGATLFGPADMQLSVTLDPCPSTTAERTPLRLRCLCRPTRRSRPSRATTPATSRPSSPSRRTSGHARRRVRGLRGRAATRAVFADSGGKVMSWPRPRARPSRRASRSPTTTTDRYAVDARLPVLGGQFESGQLDTVMSVTDAPAPVGGQQRRRTTPPSRAATRCSSVQGRAPARQVHYGEDMKAAENQDFISQATYCMHL